MYPSDEIVDRVSREAGVGDRGVLVERVELSGRTAIAIAREIRERAAIGVGGRRSPAHVG